MSNLSKPVLSQDEGRIPDVAGSTHYKHHDSCCSPFFLSRGIISAKAGKEGTPAFYARSFARLTLQSLALFLIIVASMMTMVKPAHASGTVTALTWHGYVQGANQGIDLFATSETEIDAMIALALPDAIATKKQWLLDLYATLGWNCPIWAEGPVVYGPSSGAYHIQYYSSCPFQGIDIAYHSKEFIGGQLYCPANSRKTGSTCTCNSPTATNPINYVPDPTATSCVPAATCLFTKVADITDPVALKYEDGTYDDTNPDIEHLTPATQAGLACIRQKVDAANCYMTPQPTSGYRPTAYQTHILEVYDTWEKIKDNIAPECAETKAAIEKEFKAHRPFARRPGVTSNHSQLDALGNPAGNAVDISFVPDDANISADAIACQCNMYRPMINMPDPTKNDPVHYQPRTCPR